MATSDQDLNLEHLIESGAVNDSTDIGEIIAKLNGVDEKPDGSGAQEDAPADEPKKTDGEGASETAGAEAPGIEEAAASAAPAEEAAEPDGDSPDEGEDPSNFKQHPLYGVLKGTRQTLARIKKENRVREEQLLREKEELRQQNDALRQKVEARLAEQEHLQRAADDAGFVDEDGNPIDVGTINIDKLREDYDGPLVEAIANLQTLIATQGRTIAELREKTEQQESESRSRVSDEVQADIDSIPVLAAWQADHIGNKDSTMWNRAIQLDNALRTEPAWQSKSRLERFQEIARILGGPAPATTPPAASTTKPAPKPNTAGKDPVAAAKQKAIASASPISLSELPSGMPAAQDEQESLESLDVTQVAEKLASMTPAQQEALLQRLG